MTAKTQLPAPKRRTRAEVQRLVAEFVSTGMRRSEFCQSRGLSFSTLDRHQQSRCAVGCEDLLSAVADEVFCWLDRIATSWRPHWEPLGAGEPWLFSHALTLLRALSKIRW